ncbi:hypothetical protein BJ741DRAFT_585978 [Chytriomyces cf. hyalinus JEL632]|nr:hypothetical protein BJ741DRAFT_585978 [Chytriomyces cf. hyalinus JEL632]
MTALLIFWALLAAKQASAQSIVRCTCDDVSFTTSGFCSGMFNSGMDACAATSTCAKASFRDCQDLSLYFLFGGLVTVVVVTAIAYSFCKQRRQQRIRLESSASSEYLIQSSIFSNGFSYLSQIGSFYQPPPQPVILTQQRPVVHIYQVPPHPLAVAQGYQGHAAMQRPAAAYCTGGCAAPGTTYAQVNQPQYSQPQCNQPPSYPMNQRHEQKCPDSPYFV